MGEMGMQKPIWSLCLLQPEISGNLRAEVLALLELSRVLVWLDRRTCLELVEQAMIRSNELDDKILQSIVKGMWGGLNLVICALACRLCSCLQRRDGSGSSQRKSACIALPANPAYLCGIAGLALQKRLRNSRESLGVIANAGRRLYVHGRSLLLGIGVAASGRMGQAASRLRRKAGARLSATATMPHCLFVCMDRF